VLPADAPGGVTELELLPRAVLVEARRGGLLAIGPGADERVAAVTRTFGASV
jgi:hypothetical protein